MKHQRGLLELLLMTSAITGYTGILVIFDSQAISNFSFHFKSLLVSNDFYFHQI